MKTQIVSSMGLQVPIQVPESVEEFELNAGGGVTPKVGSCLAEATLNIVYRCSLAEFRSSFSDAIENETGIERKTEPTGKKKKVKTVVDGVETETEEDILRYAETESVYFNRVQAETKKKAEDFKDLANKIASEIKFDASATERVPTGPKKTPKVYLDAASTLIAANQASQVAANLSKILGVTIGADLESLGKGIQQYEAKKRAEEQKNLANKLSQLSV